MPGLVRAAERNFNRGSSSVAIFEIGRVFRAATQEESVSLAILVSGERQSKSWNQEAAVFDLFDLKGILQDRPFQGFGFRARTSRPVSLRSSVECVDGEGQPGGQNRATASGVGKRDRSARSRVWLPN